TEAIPDETKSLETKSLETKTASAEGVLELRSTVGHTVMSDVTTGNASVHDEAAKTDTAAEVAKSEGTKSEATKSEPVKADTAATEKKPDAPVTAIAPAQAASPDANKDQTRLA